MNSLDVCSLYKPRLILSVLNLMFWRMVRELHLYTPVTGKQPDQSAVTGVEESVPEPSVPSPPTTGYVMAQKLLSKDQTQGKSNCLPD